MIQLSALVVALSGRVAAGKSTLAKGLVDRYGGRHIRTHLLLQEHAQRLGISDLADRRGLQSYGEELDEATDGAWLAEMVAPLIARLPSRSLVVIDAIRIRRQLDHLHSALGRRVTHIHVDAAYDDLERRYASRATSILELPSYADVAADPTESQVGSLSELADLVLINKSASERHDEDLVLRAAAQIGLLPGNHEPLVDVVIGGDFGSEGKGNICFYLAPEYDVLVRVGGPNAGHKVPTNPVFTHRLLPSGTMANEDALIVLGAGAVLNVEVLLAEISSCKVEAQRLFIDPQAMIIETEDFEAERALQESIASTRQGVGAATARKIMGRAHYPQGIRLAGDVPELAPYTTRRAVDVLSDAYMAGHRILLEGTQGTGLSLHHGSYPHVTSRDTTAAGCIAEAGISPKRVRKIIMVSRTYPIRVGGPSGPLAGEVAWEEVASTSPHNLEDLRRVERGSVTGNERRVGAFVWSQLRRAAELNGATDIALTFLDYISPENQYAHRFDQLNAETQVFVEEVERVAGCPVSILSCEFDQRAIIDRRNWRGELRLKRAYPESAEDF